MKKALFSLALAGALAAGMQLPASAQAVYGDRGVQSNHSPALDSYYSSYDRDGYRDHDHYHTQHRHNWDRTWYNGWYY